MLVGDRHGYGYSDCSIYNILMVGSPLTGASTSDGLTLAFTSRCCVLTSSPAIQTYNQYILLMFLLSGGYRCRGTKPERLVPFSFWPSAQATRTEQDWSSSFKSAKKRLERRRFYLDMLAISPFQIREALPFAVTPLGLYGHRLLTMLYSLGYTARRVFNCQNYEHRIC